jgi:protein N-terminal amidase
MDINPYKFKSSFYDYEFANYHVEQNTDIILCSMAWLKSKEGSEMSTIRYWATRLLPLHENVKEDKHTLFVACNRTGLEKESEFAGASCILDISDENIVILNYMNSDNTGIMVVEL